MSKGVCVVRCKKCIATDLSAIVIPDLNLKRSEGDGVADYRFEASRLASRPSPSLFYGARN